MKTKKYKTILTILITLISIVIISIIIYQKFETNKNNTSDNIKFASEFKNITNNNLYNYININEAIQLIEKGTGIIFLGFPKCIWCESYASLLNETTIEQNLDKIYYLNILNERKNNTNSYQKLIKLLEKYLPYNDEGLHVINVPSTIIVKNGKIIAYNDETSIMNKNTTPETYWTEENKSIFMKKISEYLYNLK